MGSFQKREDDDQGVEYHCPSQTDFACRQPQPTALLVPFPVVPKYPFPTYILSFLDLGRSIQQTGSRAWVSLGPSLLPNCFLLTQIAQWRMSRNVATIKSRNFSCLSLSKYIGDCGKRILTGFFFYSGFWNRKTRR